MKITIHRGANQIGGCVTEIASDKSRILIDLGNNLPGTEAPDFTPDEITHLCKGIDAIFYTHYHNDHIGHLADVPDHIDQYVGKLAKEVMLCKYKTLSSYLDCTNKIRAIKKAKCYQANKTIRINRGDIKVTPYFVSHSAADAYMFKIETSGVTILHTGDFRKHGYLGKGLIPMLEKYIGKVDFLIIEGTMLSRQNEEVPHEVMIQKQAHDLLKRESDNYFFALCSSTDIDRLASFHAACKKAGTVFACDLYQKRILDLFTKHCGKKSELCNFNDTFVIDGSSDFEQLKQRGFIIPIRPSSLSFVKKMQNHFTHTELIYSTWSGYYNGTEKQINQNVIRLIDTFNPNVHYIHTSGHADIDTLQEVCQTVQPRLGIIPIHKEETSNYVDLPISETLHIISSSTEIGNNVIEIK